MGPDDLPPALYAPAAARGARWFYRKQQEQAEALDFVRMLLDAPIPRIALENPVGIISTKIRKPEQVIQPFYFGDPAMKTTCLWLKNLPPLAYTHIMAERRQEAWLEPSGPNQARNRSRTYQGIANAMAEQYGRIGSMAVVARIPLHRAAWPVAVQLSLFAGVA